MRIHVVFIFTILSCASALGQSTLNNVVNSGTTFLGGRRKVGALGYAPDGRLRCCG